jgi:hypothetical protein
MNSVEHVWGGTKLSIFRTERVPINLQRTTKLREEIPQQFLVNLFTSKKRRARALLVVNGEGERAGGTAY